MAKQSNPVEVGFLRTIIREGLEAEKSYNQIAQTILEKAYVFPKNMLEPMSQAPSSGYINSDHPVFTSYQKTHFPDIDDPRHYVEAASRLLSHAEFYEVKSQERAREAEAERLAIEAEAWKLFRKVEFPHLRTTNDYENPQWDQYTVAYKNKYVTLYMAAKEMLSGK